jgi:hypothetical protein
MKLLSNQSLKLVAGGFCHTLTQEYEVNSNQTSTLTLTNAHGTFSVTLNHDGAVFGDGTIALSGPGSFTLCEGVTFSAVPMDDGLLFTQYDQICF